MTQLRAARQIQAGIQLEIAGEGTHLGQGIAMQRQRELAIVRDRYGGVVLEELVRIDDHGIDGLAGQRLEIARGGAGDRGIGHDPAFRDGRVDGRRAVELDIHIAASRTAATTPTTAAGRNQQGHAQGQPGKRTREGFHLSAV